MTNGEVKEAEARKAMTFDRTLVDLLKDSLACVKDYQGGLEFGAYDRKLIGCLKVAIDEANARPVAAPITQAVKVPLTPEQIQDAWAAASDPDCAEMSIFDFARAIEHAHGIHPTEGERSHD